MIHRAVSLLLAAILATGCGGVTGGSASTTVRVAAASDLRFALDEIVAELAETEPDLDLAVTYGSSGVFHQQIANGAPFDLYLSADLSYPQDLVAAGLADEADLFEYAVGRLVVWAPHSSPVDPTAGVDALLDPAAQRIAIANPEHAPYGVAAVAALESAGILDDVRPRFVLGENIAQAAEFVQSGNAQVGILALSLALAPQLAERGRWVEVPLDSFPRLLQGGVIPAAAAQPDGARAVRAFLLGEQGRAILKRYGFYEPGA
ncbi:molybdate ABC transporter substrate-binding protein [Nocardioides limicola]|uniref:molybdate ABC transporter substrate-binding protein n=1 Tax=Nocardioides limicola TaxID=2803368 RepID=UPI00193BCB65|nr:molybdate ABC transporter substrate-binding protein [Nocardioides sp. DJM-14]